MTSSTPATRPRQAPPAAGIPPADVAQRPRARDLFIDVVRGLAIVGVVLGHWLMPEASWDGQTLWVGNALRHGQAWVLTWLQPLALLFFAAGAAGTYQRRATTRRHGAATPGSTRTGGARARIRAVLVPVAVFGAVWAIAVAVLPQTGVPADVWRMALMAPQPLWFLAVWVVLGVLSPVLARLWARWRWRAMIVVVGLPLLVDALRFGAGVELIAWSNLILAWAVPYVAGVAYASDRLAARSPEPGARRPGPRASTWLVGGVIAGFAATAILTRTGPYPLSLIGMPGAAISNLGPPTAPIVAQGIALVCVVLLARTALVRWAGRPWGKAVVRALARRSMTIYLWHTTAMFVVVGIGLLGAGLPLPEPWSASWWWTRPLWLGAFALVLLALVRTFGRFEVRNRWRAAPAWPRRWSRTGTDRS